MIKSSCDLVSGFPPTSLTTRGGPSQIEWGGEGAEVKTWHTFGGVKD